ncbi:MAG TPA: hypothetical protein VHJ20_17495 [Polyangia bacterium]|nr:hypothetical protein [Polyangia bacterium]
MTTLKTKLVSFALAAAAFVGVATSSAPSVAATRTGCQIWQIQYDTGRVALWCVGDTQIYYSFNAASGPSWGSACVATAGDTQKIWLSMLQSSLLAGRTVDFDYSSPTNCAIPNISSLRTH